MRVKRMDLASGCRVGWSSATLLAVIAGDRTDEAGTEPVPPLVSAWALARVAGPSMSPTVRSGDRLLVRRVSTPRRARGGGGGLAPVPPRPPPLVVERGRRAGPRGAWGGGGKPPRPPAT